MSSYTLLPLRTEQQLTLLQSRGMIITDVQKALLCLERIGYSRLSSYWHSFQQSRHVTDSKGRTSPIILEEFRPGITFSHALALYVFDKRLRLLMLDALERIEIALRVDIAQLLGTRTPWAHLIPGELHGNFAKKRNPDSGRTYHEEWIERLNKAIDRSSKDLLTHLQAGDSPLPLWLATELWDFGQLSTFYSGMKVVDREAVAGKYGITRFDMFTNWVHVMNYVRNVCAHHSRLWNRTLAIKQKLPKTKEIHSLEHSVGDTNAQSNFYSVAAIIQHLLTTISPYSSWKVRLKGHIATFPEVSEINICQAGFPKGWEGLELWNVPCLMREYNNHFNSL